MAKTSSYSGKGGIKVSVNFEPLLEKIKDAGGEVEPAIWEAARKGAKVMYDNLKSEASASGVPSSVTDEIAFKCERDGSGNRVACNVGWRVNDYNPKNPSAAYKAIFMNYGTPRRYVKRNNVRRMINGKWVTMGVDRGYVDGRGFIGRAKKKARPQIKKAQEEALKRILKEME